MSNTKRLVNVNSKLTVVSDTPVRPGKTYPLSILDHAMGLHTLHIVFYYRYNRPDSHDLGRLRESLAEMLSSYPPVTGRLRRAENGNWDVACNDAGVRVLNAKVEVTLDEWLRSADASGERELTAWEDMPEDPSMWSPFRVQIKYFRDPIGSFLQGAAKAGRKKTDADNFRSNNPRGASPGCWTLQPLLRLKRILSVCSETETNQMNDFKEGGLAIGLSCMHMYTDPTCATILFKSWTESHRRVSIAHTPFFHPPGLHSRTSPNTNTESARYYATKSKVKPPSPVKMSTATFRFSSTMIKQCLSEVHMECPDATPFDMLAALFWACVTRAKTPTQDQIHTLSICTDFRKLMHAPLPHGYFGNALHFSMVSSKAGEMDEGGLAYLAGLVHHHISGIEEEEFWSAIDWLELQRGEGGKYAPPFRMYGPELTCANMEHVFAYAAILEDMKPVHVAYHIGNVEGEGLILVLPSPEEGLGRTVMVTLPEDQIDKLCEDPAILHLEPTMLVSGRR